MPRKPQTKARRDFFRTALLATAGSQAALPAGAPTGGTAAAARAQSAFDMRVRQAQEELDKPWPAQTGNNDEQVYGNKAGNYSKGLPHNDLGEVEPGAYQAMVAAATSGKPEDFEKIPLGSSRKLTNPQAGLAFEFQGGDPQAFAMPPAPALASAEIAGEIVELYWAAMLRDVPFRDYGTSPTAARAAGDISRLSNFRGPKQDGLVTTGTLFRDNAVGATAGPYISQFLWLPSPFGAEPMDRRLRTTMAGIDYMTNYDEWLGVQRGSEAYRPAVYDTTPRYIRNGRDLGEWVHIDVLFQAYFQAMLVLMSMDAPIDTGNPYLQSRTQIGFGTLGAPYIASTLCAVAKPALKAVWYQKWFVHRKLRPEAFAARVHHRINGNANYPIHVDVVNSFAIGDLARRNGTYLLPQAFPEGSPTHPSYGAGHATVAGACTTILKALFDESFIIPRPVEATADGLALESYRNEQLTVGGELNKLAANIAHGRNIAGVHWRSDAVESMKLGEAVAIRYLQQEKACFNENFGGYSLTKFDGTRVTI